MSKNKFSFSDHIIVWGDIFLALAMVIAVVTKTGVDYELTPEQIVQALEKSPH